MAEHWGAGVEHQRLRAVGVGGDGQEKGSERKRDWEEGEEKRKTPVLKSA
jgi:hypothetical protein